MLLLSFLLHLEGLLWEIPQYKNVIALCHLFKNDFTFPVDFKKINFNILFPFWSHKQREEFSAPY
jgi:hypothetical protein